MWHCDITSELIMRILSLLPALALLATVRAGWKSPNSAFRELMRAALTSLWDFTSDQVSRKFWLKYQGSLILCYQILDEVRTESLRAAGFQDTDDCAKKLLCELARKSKFDSKIDSLPEIPNASSFPGGDAKIFDIFKVQHFRGLCFAEIRSCMGWEASNEVLP